MAKDKFETIEVNVDSVEEFLRTETDRRIQYIVDNNIEAEEPLIPRSQIRDFIPAIVISAVSIVLHHIIQFAVF